MELFIEFPKSSSRSKSRTFNIDVGEAAIVTHPTGGSSTCDKTSIYSNIVVQNDLNSSAVYVLPSYNARPKILNTF